MQLTLKDNIDLSLVATQHEILLQATGLLVGREGTLDTEKELYLILAIVEAAVNEDVVQLCNEDKRDLFTLMQECIEPFFCQMKQDGVITTEIYTYLKESLLKRCKQIWDNQHSAMGVIDTLLTAITMMSDEDKKEVLNQTAKVAEKAFDRRTEVMEGEIKQTNSKLEALIQQYQKQPLKENDAK